MNISNVITALLFCFCTTNLQAQLSATVSSVNPGCATSNGSASVTASGATGYTYKWSTGATTATVSNLPAGTYTVTVYSSGGILWDTIYFETFEGSHNWTLNTSTGANGVDNNYWQVNDDESGRPAGVCGSAGQNNKTLHITSVAQFASGAAYDAGGLCGLLYCPLTNIAASSPDINTSGATNLLLQYDFIGAGDGLLDNASALISANGGASFNSLDASLKSNNTGCGGQGRWTTRSYSLTNTYNGLSNFKIRFNWTNNDDGVGTDPSVAINNILLRDSIPQPGDSVVKTVTLTQPLSPYFVTAALSIVQPGCGQSNGSINNVGIAGGTSPYSLTWKISGAVIGSGNSLTNIGGGTYTLEVTDANGCFIDTSFTLLAGTDGGTVSVTRSDTVICSGDSALFCAPQGYASYLWSNGATSACIQAKLAGNYRVTVTDNGGCSATSVNYALIVNTLPPVSISVNGNVLSSFNAASYQWFFEGSPIPNATSSTYTAQESGNYQVLVTDANGCKALSNATNVIVSGVNKTAADINFSVFPNPASTGFYLLTAFTEGSYELTVTNPEGRTVATQTIYSDKTYVNVLHLTPGLYFIRYNGLVQKLLIE